MRVGRGKWLGQVDKMVAGGHETIERKGKSGVALSSGWINSGIYDDLVA